MEITCLDRYDNNGEHNDISDMSNHSERSSNITSTISITSNNKINDHRYLTNNKEIVKIKSSSTSYDDEDDDDDDDEEESNDCCIKGQSLILWLRINYVDIFRGIGSKFILLTFFSPYFYTKKVNLTIHAYKHTHTHVQ